MHSEFYRPLLDDSLSITALLLPRPKLLLRPTQELREAPFLPEVEPHAQLVTEAEALWWRSQEQFCTRLRESVLFASPSATARTT